MITNQSTFRQLTAPGYFDFSVTQTSKTREIISWFDSISNIITSNINLMDETFRLWASRNYSSVTVTMTPWIKYLLTQNGIGWFNQSIAIAVSLISYLSKSYPSSTIESIQQLFQFIENQGWISSPGQIFFGSEEPAKFAETFLIYSNSGTLPSTPPSSVYVPLEWESPIGWSKAASSATYYSRGYISAGNIIWMTPQSTNTVYIMQDVADLTSLPVSPSTAQLCGVYDDGTGDIGSVYYYDGGTWRKTTGVNANQGIVLADAPDPGSSVFDIDDGLFSSQQPPPVTGPSQGYGYYGIYGQFPLFAKRIDVSLALTTLGESYLGIIIILFQKLKPTLNSLFINYTTPTNLVYTEVEIIDSGAV